jgi:hypothetical protein
MIHVLLPVKYYNIYILFKCYDHKYQTSISGIAARDDNLVLRWCYETSIGTNFSIILVGTLAISLIYGLISSSSCRCTSFVVALASASAFSSQILSHKSKIKVLRNSPYQGSCHLEYPQSKSLYQKNQITISTTGFQHLHCDNRMNKREIELHYLPCSICGVVVLSFHHSTKSIEASSSRIDTKWVGGMRRGSSQDATGWAAPSHCSLLHWKSVFLLRLHPRMVPTTRRSWSQMQPWSSQGSKCCTLLVKMSARVFYCLCFCLLPRCQNVLKNPRTPAKMKCCITGGSGYYLPVEEGLFWILYYIEVYTWTTIKTN